MSLAALDAVTIDAHGTLVDLDRPVERLREALSSRGVERSVARVRRAFRAEVAYYSAHRLEGGTASSLADLRARCARVFVDAVDEPALDFAAEFVEAMVFAPLPGVRHALERLRAHGLALAVVSNWDVGLHEHLASLRLAPYFETVVTSAEIGAAKPDPALFRVALERLGVAAARALHVGDGDDDAQGAAAAGLRFARAPLAEALA